MPRIETYLAHGGYESLRKAVTMKPAEIVDADQSLQSARPRRRGLSLRRKVGLHQTR